MVDLGKWVKSGHPSPVPVSGTTATLPKSLTDWPGIAPMFQLHTRRFSDGHTEQETVYGITSLTTDQADASELLTLARGHWGIENQLHYVRDVTLGEDACRVRSKNAPQLLAAARNLALGILRPLGFPSIAAATRRIARSNRDAPAPLALRPPRRQKGKIAKGT